MRRRRRERGPAWWSRDGHGHYRRERPGSDSRGRHFRELEWVFSSGGLAPVVLAAGSGAKTRPHVHVSGTQKEVPRPWLLTPGSVSSHQLQTGATGAPFPGREQDESIQNPLLSNFLPNPAPTRGPRFCMVSPTANFPPGRPENHKLEAKRLM